MKRREAHGILQTDIILRSGIIEAIRRLRNDPRLFDAIFLNLREDPLTRSEYGDKEIEQAKIWFYGGDGKAPVDLPVVMSYRIVPGDLQFPMISISLMESSEAEQTHGDVHYQPVEVTEADWPPLAGPFTPDEYVASSGMMIIPDSVKIPLLAGMFILDATGRAHQVNQVLDDNLISIKPGTVADFRGAYLKGAKPRLVETVESVNMRETYQVGIHVQGESFHLTYLHAVMQFALLHYKQDLLEERGIERTSISSSEFMRNSLFGNEVVFSRGITINGFVRQIWPKRVEETVESFAASLVMTKGNSPEPVPTEGPADSLWVAESD